MKTINVVAAVIIRTASDGTKEVFATQRGYGEYKDWWENRRRRKPGISPCPGNQRRTCHRNQRGRLYRYNRIRLPRFSSFYEML